MKIFIFLVVGGILCFHEVNAATYYWVGSGNWNNLSNWALSSCSGTTPTSLPGSGDNVVFGTSSGGLGSCSNNKCSINTSITVSSFTVYSNYTDSIVQGSGNSITKCIRRLNAGSTLPARFDARITTPSNASSRCSRKATSMLA